MKKVLENPPFIKAHQLCSDLDIHVSDLESSKLAWNSSCPGRLPGQPSILLKDMDEVNDFLKKELWAQALESRAPWLWLLSTQRSDNINPIHQQRVRGREILVTEDPRLHLVWIHDRMYIKPLPRYLMSHAFWEQYLTSASISSSTVSHCPIQRAALGYLRTYRHLIRHESDFVPAKKLRLIPDSVTWPQFCDFAADISCIDDTEVSPRYHYGELRLSRLNLYAPLLFQSYYYERVYWQYNEYFARLFAPVILIFALVTTSLNAMQVGLATEEVSGGSWEVYWAVCRWFSTISLLGTGLLCAFFLLVWIWLIADECVFAIRKRLGRSDESKC